MDDDANVKVFCRVRPPNERESGVATDSALGGSSGYFARARAGSARARKCVAVPAGDAAPQTVVLQPRHGANGPRQFTFDRVFGEAASQTEVFEVVGVPITRACLEGYNGTIFAYGQTGSGKTFTMQGPDDVIAAESHALADEERALRGLVPRVFDYLFENVVGSEAEAPSGVTRRHTFACSFLEIYNERVYDLLDGGSANDAAGLQLRESGRKGVVVDGLLESVVTSARQAAELMKIGARNRRVGQTTMNRESSRSHSVFILHIQSQEITPEGTKTRRSRFNLVDLAGSERQRSTEAAGDRLKEAGSINKSLSALGNVIMGLVDQSAGKSRHVHYRDSKLTFLLKDSLGGNSKTFMIATISPADDSSFETLSTLKFAQRAKMIRNNAVINEDASGSNHYLQQEVARLRRELEHAKADSARQGWHPGAGSVLANQTSIPMDYSGDQPLDAGSDHAVALRIRELEEALASTLEKSDQLERSCDRLMVREEHLEALCAELKKSILQLKLMLRLRGSKQGGDDASEYAPSVDAVEWRIKYEELEDEFARLQEEFARCQPADEAMGESHTDVRSEVESLNILLMALTRQLALVVRDKHDLQDRLEGKRASEDLSMDEEDGSEGSLDFSARLEEALKQQALEFEARISCLQCEAQIMEEKTAETSLELLQMKQREAAYNIQLSEATTKLSMLETSLSNAEQEREEARAMSVQHQVRIQDLSLQVERVKESVRIDFEQQLIDSQLANDKLARSVKQLDDQVAQLSVSRHELETQTSMLRSQLDSKQSECSTLSSQLELQEAESKRTVEFMEQLKSDSSMREAALSKTIDDTAAMVKRKEEELRSSVKKAEELETLVCEKSQALAELAKQLEDVESALGKTAAAKLETEQRAVLLDEAVAALGHEKRHATEELDKVKNQFAKSEELRQATSASLDSATERVAALEEANALLSSRLETANGELNEEKRAADALRDALDGMTREVAKLKDAGAKLQHEKDELSAAVTQASDSIKTLRQEADDAAKAHEELVARLTASSQSEKEALAKEFEQTLRVKDDQLAAHAAAIQEAEERFQKLQAAEEAARAAADQLRSEFGRFQADTASAQVKHEEAYETMKAELEHELQSIRQKAADDAARFDHDRLELTRQREQLEARLEEQARAQQTTVQALTAEVAQLKQDVAHRSEAVEKEAEANSALRTRVEALTTELAGATQELGKARDAVASLEIQLSETQSSNAERIDSLVNEVAAKSERIAQLSSESDDKSSQHAEFKTKCEQQLAAIERLTIAVEDAKAERVALESSLSSELRAATSKADELQAQLSQHVSAVAQLKAANASLKENLEAEMAEKRAAKESFARAQTQWEEECRSLVDKAEIMQRELQTSKSTVDANVAAVKRLEEQLAQAKGDASEKSAAVARLDGELAARKQELERSEEQLGQAKAQWSEEERALVERATASEEENRASKKALTDLQSAVALLEQAGREAKEELADKTEAIRTLGGELTDLQKALKAAAAENERLKAQQQRKSELVAQTDDLKRRKAELALAEASVRSDMKKLEKRGAAVAAMEQELKALRSESAEAKQRIKKLETASRQLATDKQKLEGDARDLRAKLQSLSQANDQLVSHHNSRQKIQYHIRVKEQNNQLLEQVRYLTDDQFKLKRTLDRMRTMLKEKENVSDNRSVGAGATKPRASPAPSPSRLTSANDRAKSSGSAGGQAKSPRPSKRPRTRQE